MNLHLSYDTGILLFLQQKGLSEFINFYHILYTLDPNIQV